MFLKLDKKSLFVKFFCIVALLTNAAQAQQQPMDDYSAGMQAFFDEDYAQAQTLWLKSAQANNPKAMFNLGLLHERKVISGANDQKAETWFKLAGTHGYPAGYYHLAKHWQSSNIRQTEAHELMVKAANANFVPAQVALNGAPQAPVAAARAPYTAPVQQTNNYPTNTTNYPVAAPVVTQAPVAAVNNAAIEQQVNLNTNRVVLSQPKNYWTIQLSAFKELAGVQSYIQQHNLTNRVDYFSELSNGTMLYKLVYGAYPTKAEADSARNSLPAQLRSQKPWLRTIGSIKISQ